MRRMASGHAIDVRTWRRRRRFSSGARIAELYMDDRIVDYIVDIVHHARTGGGWSQGSRAADRVRREPTRHNRWRRRLARMRSCAAERFVAGRHQAPPDVLRHRVLTTFEAGPRK